MLDSSQICDWKSKQKSQCMCCKTSPIAMQLETLPLVRVWLAKPLVYLKAQKLLPPQVLAFFITTFGHVREKWWPVLSQCWTFMMQKWLYLQVYWPSAGGSAVWRSSVHWLSAAALFGQSATNLVPLKTMWGGWRLLDTGPHSPSFCLHLRGWSWGGVRSSGVILLGSSEQAEASEFGC